MSYPNIYKRKILSIAILSTLGVSQTVIADEAEATAESVRLAPVVVTATRVEQNSFDLPVAIDVVSKENIQDGQLQLTLGESLIRVPGITAQNRNNQAQDPQISTRGFGARSSFGVRGVRVYVDGIPLTMPDGQGQPGIVDLSAIKSIEVMRGPFSSLYGNSSGGVIQLLTEDAPTNPEVGASVMFGSYGTKRQVLNATGTADGVEYLLNASNYETDGYRDHNSGDKQQATAKFKINFSEDTKLTTLVNWFDQKAEDPGGLKRELDVGEPSAFTDPKRVSQSSIIGNTRVYRSHTQVGFNLEHAFNSSNAINVMTYVGTRENEQYLYIGSPTPQTGRASIISRDFWGTDIRWNNKGELLSRPYSVTAGVTYGKMNDDRMDISTKNGITNPKSNLANVNRDEVNIATNFDQYLQAQWAVIDDVDLHAGIRRTKVKLEVEDNLVNATNIGKFKDTSGNVEFRKTTPVIGAIWKVNPTLNLYANYGKGFETPSFIESAYDSLSGTGPNLNIKPSTSDNYEVGLKSFITDNTRVNVAIFKTDTDKEIVAISGAPYQVYMNAGKTKRKGVEMSVDSQLDHNFGLYAAYTYLDAKFDDAFTNANKISVDSGNYIPGTYRSQLYGEVSWKAPSIGFKTALEGRYNSKVYVDDINSDSAHSYTIFNIRAGFEQKLANWGFSEYLRVENMFDKEYIGSVRVNDTNSRFFEPSAGRNYLLGINANYKFN